MTGVHTCALPIWVAVFARNPGLGKRNSFRVAAACGPFVCIIPHVTAACGPLVSIIPHVAAACGPFVCIIPHVAAACGFLVCSHPQHSCRLRALRYALCHCLHIGDGLCLPPVQCPHHIPPNHDTQRRIGQLRFCVLLLAHTSCQYQDRVDSAAPAGANRGAVLYSLYTLLYYNARDCNGGRHFFMNK